MRGSKHGRWIEHMFSIYERIFCQYCGCDLNLAPPAFKPAKNKKKNKKLLEEQRYYATVDHVMPKSKYPNLKNDRNNFVTCCPKCNTKKKDEEWEVEYKYPHNANSAWI